MTRSALKNVCDVCRRQTPSDWSARFCFRRYAVIFVLLISLFQLQLFAASEHHGMVTFNGLPVPGATITATEGDKRLVAISNQQGVYTFTDIEDGLWKFQVEMVGFGTQSQDIAVAADSSSPTWELKLLPLEEITRGITIINNKASTPTAGSPGSASGPPTAAAGTTSAGFQRTPVNPSSSASHPPPQPPSGAAAAASEPSNELTQSAATGLLINGSVNNGAASAFSQMAAFGNDRRRPGALYNGGFGVVFDTSSWDAAPFSLAGLATPKPAYNDVQIVGALGGPLGLPHHLIAASNFFIAYQHAASDNAVVQWGRVPTALERAGNFSQTLGAAGSPVRIFNPVTGVPFPGNIVPFNSQAAALLSEYPLPNVPSSGAYNYQAPVLNSQQQDSVQSRVSRNKGRNQLFGNFALQRQSAQTTSLFGFRDSTNTSGLDIAVNWARYYRPHGSSFLSVHFKYEFSRLTTDITPFFANRINVSGQAGISGNDQVPSSWGPPNLIFASGVAGLSEPQFARNANQTQAFSPDILWYRGRHSVQFGGDIRRQQFNIFSQQDARGTLAFTGFATQAFTGGVALPGTGSDLADFLLGIPDTVSISFGNADKYLRGWVYDAYINDDWRISSGFTLNAGLRWEYGAPLTELHDRLANLDIAPAFTSAATVVADGPTGIVTGKTYPNSLLRPDFRGIEPRVGIAWRPRPASPLIVRAGYGVYDNTSVYANIAKQLAQQPPFTKTLSVQNSATDPLTLATAFNAAPPSTPNTFAVNPNFRVGYVQNWDLSVQQDLPGSLVLIVNYLGSKGTRLFQESLPNTYPLGAFNPCPLCPAGFIYLNSNADSTREAAQIQLRRRLSNGLTATLLYTYAKAIDDASLFSGAGLATATTAASNPPTPAANSSNASTAQASAASTSVPSIAQNWLDLSAERGPSTFDQRHLLNFQMQYTSGVGIRGGAFLRGWRGPILKEWTFTAQLTVGSGLPLSPVYLTNVAGTGVTGTIRPNYTGALLYAAPTGFFLNPAAFTAPAPGQWGDAGRDSITGPAQFVLNTSIGRTFRFGSRLTLDWRMDATNVLNTVTYTTWNTTVTSPLFGLPNQANTMRKLQTAIRVRF